MAHNKGLIIIGEVYYSDEKRSHLTKLKNTCISDNLDPMAFLWSTNETRGLGEKFLLDNYEQVGGLYFLKGPAEIDATNDFYFTLGKHFEIFRPDLVKIENIGYKIVPANLKLI